MGLDINVKKPIKFIGTERPDDEEIDYFCLYTLGFEPIMHLRKDTGSTNAPGMRNTVVHMVHSTTLER